MDNKKRDQIRRSLRNLANSYVTTMELMQQTLSLICDEYSLDSESYWKATITRELSRNDRGRPIIDNSLLSVTYRGKSCFLGNTLPFKLLARLNQRPNIYVSHAELLADVWRGVRSGEALRSVVKTLRGKLRQAGMAELAKCIDGSVRGHYALKLD